MRSLQKPRCSTRGSLPASVSCESQKEPRGGRLQLFLGPSDDKREAIEERYQEEAPERHAEKIPLGEEDVAEQHDQAKREQKDRLEQEIAVCQGQVAIHRAEQDEAVAMAGVEADPGLLHRCLARDDRRHLLHARV